MLTQIKLIKLKGVNNKRRRSTFQYKCLLQYLSEYDIKNLSILLKVYFTLLLRIGDIMNKTIFKKETKEQLLNTAIWTLVMLMVLPIQVDM